MAIPSVPQNMLLQQGNGDVFVSWDISSTATSYSVARSTDGVTYAVINSPTAPNYLDTSVTVGTTYYYKVLATNGDGSSAYCTAQTVVPVNTGDMTLGQIRTMAQQRADMVNSNFVSTTEWNTYINNSYFELYDLLVTTYEDYYITSPYTISTDGTNLITLPTDMYKLNGVDLGLSNSSNAWVTLQKFDFISRNRFIYPQLTSTYPGFFGLSYRLVGNKLMLIPTPPAGQYLRIWYTPKLTQLLQDNDIAVGISGWLEYVVVDAAIKAMQKEESDVSVLMAEKMALIKRIEESAMNRDAGQADTISDTRRRSSLWGGYGPNGDGNFGGF